MSRSERRRVNQAAGHGVMIGYLTPDHNSAHFQISLRALEAWDRNHTRRVAEYGDVVTHICGPRVASGRNELVRAFLGHPKRPEWLLMLDSDMVFPATLVEDLVSVADPQVAPVVGGLCFAGGRSGQVRPTMSVMVGDDPPAFEVVWDYPPDAMVGVDYTGAACLLMHRGVLERLGEKFADRAHPWFAESEFSGREYGEDVTFCMRLRALGVPIFVHTGIKIGHMKMLVIDEQSYLTFRRGITEHGEDGHRDRELARRFVGGAR